MTSKPSNVNPRRLPYTHKEDLKIINFIHCHREGSNATLDTLSKELAKSMDRSWQSIKERFLSVIMTNLKTYKVGQDVKRKLEAWYSSKAKQRSTGRRVFDGSLLNKLYTREEDRTIINYILQNNREYSVKGNTVWQRLEGSQLVAGRSWQSLRSRYINVMSKNFGKFTTEDNARRLRAAFRGKDSTTDDSSVDESVAGRKLAVNTRNAVIMDSDNSSDESDVGRKWNRPQNFADNAAAFRMIRASKIKTSEPLSSSALNNRTSPRTRSEATTCVEFDKSTVNSHDRNVGEKKSKRLEELRENAVPDPKIRALKSWSNKRTRSSSNSSSLYTSKKKLLNVVFDSDSSSNESDVGKKSTLQDLPGNAAAFPTARRSSKPKASELSSSSSPLTKNRTSPRKRSDAATCVESDSSPVKSIHRNVRKQNSRRPVDLPDNAVSDPRIRRDLKSFRKRTGSQSSKCSDSSLSVCVGSDSSRNENYVENRKLRSQKIPDNAAAHPKIRTLERSASESSSSSTGTISDEAICVEGDNSIAGSIESNVGKKDSREFQYSPGGAAPAISDQTQSPRSRTHLMAKDCRSRKRSGNIFNLQGKETSSSSKRLVDEMDSDKANQSSNTVPTLPEEFLEQVGRTLPAGPWVIVKRLPESVTCGKSGSLSPTSRQSTTHVVNEDPAFERAAVEDDTCGRNATSTECDYSGDTTGSFETESIQELVLPRSLNVMTATSTFDVIRDIEGVESRMRNSVSSSDQQDRGIQRLSDDRCETPDSNTESIESPKQQKRGSQRRSCYRLETEESNISDAETLIIEPNRIRTSADEREDTSVSDSMPERNHPLVSDDMEEISAERDIQQEPVRVVCTVDLGAMRGVSRGPPQESSVFPCETVRQLESCDSDESTVWLRQGTSKAVCAPNRYARLSVDESFAKLVESPRSLSSGSSSSDSPVWRLDMKPKSSNNPCICSQLPQLPSSGGEVIFDPMYVGFQNGCKASRRRQKRNLDPFLPFP